MPKNARIIDASAKCMIPGLWDMHVHFRGGPDLIPDNEAWLAIFLANGITGRRQDCQSRPAHGESQEDIKNTRKIDAAVLKGKLLTRMDLDKLLQDVAVKAAATSHQDELRRSGALAECADRPIRPTAPDIVNTPIYTHFEALLLLKRARGEYRPRIG